jgi:hypothetical protein
MPNFAEYVYSYALGPSLPDEFTTFGVRSGPDDFDISDTQDGMINGQTEIGNNVNLDSAGGAAQLAGMTGAGDPILFHGGVYFVYSNSSGLNGTFVNPVLGGTFTFCFAAGTTIATATGETVVEDLAIGQTVLTAAGVPVPVKWIGRQTLHKVFSGRRMQPVRIRAGGLGGGLPHSDLTVTPDHGMVLEGLVINASALVNGTTIDFVPLDELPERVTYYHLETENHDVILANGAPAETYLDMPGRRAFDNFAEYAALYGEEQTIDEMPLPRIASARLLPARLRDRLGIAERQIA